MKKILAIAVLAVASVAASAQTYVGGSFNLSRNTTDNTTNFEIAPEIGYNLDAKWALGIALDYNYNYSDGLKTNVFAVNPYARYTFFNAVDNRLKLFVDGGFEVGAGKSKYEDYKSDTVTIWGIGFKPGVSFDITKRFTFEAKMGFIGYQGANDAAKEAGFANEFGVDLHSTKLTFGLYYNF